MDLLNAGTEGWHASVLGAQSGQNRKLFRPGMPGRRRLADALLFLKGGTDFSESARRLADRAQAVSLHGL